MTHSKKIILAGTLLSAALILAGCKGYGTASQTPSPQGQQETTASPTTESQVITYGDNGFSPAQLTVKAGESVTFTNGSSKTIQVNSAPHPQHTSFPELNLGKIEPGESMSVVFTTAGERKYHNHLNVSENGTITVE